ncbi:MAG: 23S rRNA (pseudouridine(1915)-N(3))-methyltransferase RlmH [Candidatus Saccharibacteria bacterium]|nr:23S rRNA (pseudouridine(1915)-N(3))-methyltransferase RlmH [Candidatus Saccharibacteria bacterium]
MNILVISVGARPKVETSSLVNDFIKRLPKHIKVQWQYIKHGQGTIANSKQQESEQILRALPKLSTVVLLDETGKQLSSPELAARIFNDGKDVTLIIGGAYGVSEEVKHRSNFVWSLGKLVYPHQLVRIILAEQIYRAYSIYTGHPYHHE